MKAFRSESSIIDDLSFSNSLTAEHNTLGGGVIGHILRNRSTNAAASDARICASPGAA